ncbi:NAD(P)-dependent oxidoreductase [Mycobacterium sp. HNNTM2301]|uniref:NAD(P)-dependent oxidoreductase n=1 Tax=Mycobacterium hainanense TaxID=3289775 RepID=UPI0035A6AB1A
MSAVTVFGATGRTGAHIVDQALTRGHHVTAVARDPEALTGIAAKWSGTGRFSTAAADVRDPAAVDAAVHESEAVISAIASAGRHPNRLFSAGTRNIVNSLRRQQIRRFICVSSRGVNFHDPGLPLVYRAVIRPLFLREVYADMRDMEAIVRESDLRWTLVRAARLTDARATGDYRVEDGRNPRGGWTLSRADLAAFILDELETPEWIGRTPTVAY